MAKVLCSLVMVFRGSLEANNPERKSKFSEVSSQRADKLVELIVLKLARLRIQKDISINKLAWMSGISPKGIAFIEQGVNSPTLRNILRLADALEVSLVDILRQIEQEGLD